MNYKLHYQKLISKYGRKDRPAESHLYERHHIVPKSMGGDNSPQNLVYLTGRQHFLAHWLLFKIHNNDQMAMAFFIMQSNKSNYVVTACEKRFSEKALRIRGMMSKSVKTPLGMFDSYRDAASAHNMPESTFQDLLRKGTEGFIDLGKTRRIIANAGGKHGMARRVKTPFGLFEYLGAAAAAHGVSNKQIGRLCEKYPDDYYYLDPPKQVGSRRNQVANKKRVMTPAGMFNSVAEAAKALGIKRESLRYKINSPFNKEFHFVE